MKKNKFFEDLKDGLESATQFEKGKLGLKKTEMKIPNLPPKISKKKIKAIWNSEKTSATCERKILKY